MTKAGAMLLFTACASPCPDSPAFCVQVDAGACVAWPATCCYGLQACKLDSTPVADAGACALIPEPKSEAVSCQ